MATNEKRIYVEFKSEVPSILAWPSVILPRTPKSKDGKPGKPQYQATFLYTLTHEDMGRFNAAMRNAADQMWGDNKVAPNDRGQMVPIQYPYELGSAIADRGAKEKKDYEAFRPYIAIKSSTPQFNLKGDLLQPPALGVENHNGEPADVPIAGPARAEFGKYFYGGVFVKFIINLNPMLSFGTPAVKAYLQTVLSLCQGEPVKAFGTGSSGERSATGAFGASSTHVGHVSNVNPLG